MRLLRLLLGLLVFGPPASFLRTLLQWTRSRTRTVLRIRISGVLEEEEGATRFAPSGASRSTTAGMVEQLKAAARDPSVEAVALRIGQLTSGWEEVEQLRQALLTLRGKGRRTFAYLESPGHLEYFLATACEHIVMPPMATLDVVGLRAEVTFFKGTLDLLGITACFEAAGEYKSFAEPFLRDSMSDAFRESLDSVLAELHGCLVDTIGKARRLSPGRVQELLDEGPWLARDAREHGLIDRTLYPDRWHRAIRKELGDLPPDAPDDDDGRPPGPFSGRRKLHFRRARRWLRGWRWVAALERRATSAPRIAVVLASGAIGGSDEADSSAGQIAWRALSTTLRAVSDDSRVAAVVLRIDSPGGSGASSDLLWRELQRLRRRKPLVASMGSTAASGGYYLAMAADAIVAGPMTITGSIGVVGGKFDPRGLLEKLGLRREVLSYGAHTGLFSPSTGLTESEREALRAHLVAFYDEFVGKAAQGRKTEHDTLEQYARGRIWTGPQALERGLVDEVGGLPEAVEEAARRAGLAPGWSTVYLTAPRPGFLRRLQQRLPLAEARAVAYHVMGWSPEDDLVQARLPFDLKIR